MAVDYVSTSVPRRDSQDPYYQQHGEGRTESILEAETEETTPSVAGAESWIFEQA